MPEANYSVKGQDVYTLIGETQAKSGTMPQTLLINVILGLLATSVILSVAIMIRLGKW